MERNKRETLRVTLLGTGGPPPIMDRFGPYKGCGVIGTTGES